jgi:hypothetical protein
MHESRRGSYDCHIDWARHMEAGTVRQAISDRALRGAVLVQAREHADDLHSLVEALGRMARARGVARIAAYESCADMVALEQCGVRGVRIDVPERGDAWDQLETLEPLHARLPAHWHIELGASVAGACALARLLARWPRCFTLALRSGRTPVQSGHASILRWWLDMGNAYLKLLPSGLDPRLPRWLASVGASAPERLLLGGHWPGTDGVHPLGVNAPAVEEHAGANACRLYGFPLQDRPALPSSSETCLAPQRTPAHPVRRRRAARATG